MLNGRPGWQLQRQGHLLRDAAIADPQFDLSPLPAFAGGQGEAQGVTRLQAAGQHYWMQPTLNDLETRLDPRQFFRVARAVIVNLDAVRELVPLIGGYGQVVAGTAGRTGRRRTARRQPPAVDRSDQQARSLVASGTDTIGGVRLQTSVNHTNSQ